MASVTVSIDAENTFSDPLEVKGNFDLSISGTFVATVVVQRNIEGDGWVDVDSFTAPIETFGFQPSFALYRVGVKTGGYTSGTAVCTLYEEDLSR